MLAGDLSSFESLVCATEDDLLTTLFRGVAEEDLLDAALSVIRVAGIASVLLEAAHAFAA